MELFGRYRRLTDVTTMAMTASARLRPWLGTAARLLLAVVFFLAGWSKVFDLAGSGRAVNAYRLMPYDAAKVVGSVLPAIELGVALFLLAGLATRVMAAITAGLLVVYIAGIASVWARGLSIDCGCFSKGGDLAAGRAAEYGREILRDVGFLVLAGVLLMKPRTRFSLDGLLMGER